MGSVPYFTVLDAKISKEGVGIFECTEEFSSCTELYLGAQKTATSVLPQNSQEKKKAVVQRSKTEEE